MIRAQILFCFVLLLLQLNFHLNRKCWIYTFEEKTAWKIQKCKKSRNEYAVKAENVYVKVKASNKLFASIFINCSRCMRLHVNLPVCSLKIGNALKWSDYSSFFISLFHLIYWQSTLNMHKWHSNCVINGT